MSSCQCAALRLRLVYSVSISSDLARSRPISSARAYSAYAILPACALCVTRGSPVGDLWVPWVADHPRHDVGSASRKTSSSKEGFVKGGRLRQGRGLRQARRASSREASSSKEDFVKQGGLRQGREASSREGASSSKEGFVKGGFVKQGRLRHDAASSSRKASSRRGQLVGFVTTWPARRGRLHARGAPAACLHTQACVYACMSACVHACMHACMHVCIRTCVYACCRHVRMHVYAGSEELSRRACFL